MTRYPDKTCPVCGRRFAWRRKWANCWEQVVYCSNACRRRKQSSVGNALERAMLDLLKSRNRGATICPSEAARALQPDNWRPLMNEAKDAMRRLAHAGSVDVMQGGKVIDAAAAQGPVRVRLRL